jgi:hypothetical protein
MGAKVLPRNDFAYRNIADIFCMLISIPFRLFTIVDSYPTVYRQ